MIPGRKLFGDKRIISSRDSSIPPDLLLPTGTSFEKLWSGNTHYLTELFSDKFHFAITSHWNLILCTLEWFGWARCASCRGEISISFMIRETIPIRKAFRTLEIKRISGRKRLSIPFSVRFSSKFRIIDVDETFVLPPLVLEVVKFSPCTRRNFCKSHKIKLSTCHSVMIGNRWT